jgi:hypothetical protein
LELKKDLGEGKALRIGLGETMEKQVVTGLALGYWDFLIPGWLKNKLMSASTLKFICVKV